MHGWSVTLKMSTRWSFSFEGCLEGACLLRGFVWGGCLQLDVYTLPVHFLHEILELGEGPSGGNCLQEAKGPPRSCLSSANSSVQGGCTTSTRNTMPIVEQGTWLGLLLMAIPEDNRRLDCKIKGRAFGAALQHSLGGSDSAWIKHRACQSLLQLQQAATGLLEEKMLPLLQHWFSLRVTKV